MTSARWDYFKSATDPNGGHIDNKMIEQLRAHFGSMIVEDTKWKGRAGSYANRGIYDYSRQIRFQRALTQDELREVCAWLHNDNCPGWTGVSGIEFGPVENPSYQFTTTMDSTD